MNSGGQLAVTITVTLTALLTFWAASRLGQRGVDHWLSAQERETLHRIRWPWWVATALCSVLVSLITKTSLLASFDVTMLIASGVFLGAYVGLLFALVRIDLASRLLPDQLTAALLLSGLIFHGLFSTGQLMAGVIGAALGYGFLWLIAKLFEALRGQEAMGRGDFFMAAGLGAWLGWQALPLLLMLASVSALIAAITIKLAAKLGRHHGVVNGSSHPFLKQEIAFGPALAFGGIATWVLQHG
jgi:prepilin signal peptidase PulO-like enzyme (type II secretory pathway)